MKRIKYLFICLFLSACIFGTSQNSKFYSFLPQSGKVLSSSYTNSVGIGRVLLPKYMDKPQIVTQSTDSAEVILSEYNRWIEAPSVLCQRSVIDNLSAALPRAQIQAQQFGTQKFDIRISIEVIKMDGILGDKANLQAWYTITKQDGQVLLRKKFLQNLSVGKTYDDLVQGYSILWHNLSYEMAKSLLANVNPS